MTGESLYEKKQILEYYVMLCAKFQITQNVSFNSLCIWSTPRLTLVILPYKTFDIVTLKSSFLLQISNLISFLH